MQKLMLSSNLCELNSLDAIRAQKISNTIKDEYNNEFVILAAFKAEKERITIGGFFYKITVGKNKRFNERCSVFIAEA